MALTEQQLKALTKLLGYSAGGAGVGGLLEYLIRGRAGATGILGGAAAGAGGYLATDKGARDQLGKFYNYMTSTTDDKLATMKDKGGAPPTVPTKAPKEVSRFDQYMDYMVKGMEGKGYTPERIKNEIADYYDQYQKVPPSLDHLDASIKGTTLDSMPGTGGGISNSFLLGVSEDLGLGRINPDSPEQKQDITDKIMNWGFWGSLGTQLGASRIKGGAGVSGVASKVGGVANKLTLGLLLAEQAKKFALARFSEEHGAARDKSKGRERSFAIQGGLPGNEAYEQRQLGRSTSALVRGLGAAAVGTKSPETAAWIWPGDYMADAARTTNYLDPTRMGYNLVTGQAGKDTKSKAIATLVRDAGSWWGGLATKGKPSMPRTLDINREGTAPISDQDVHNYMSSLPDDSPIRASINRQYKLQQK